MPATKLTLLAQLATARARLWGALLNMSEETLTTQAVAGSWTAKDELGHVAFWDNLRAEQLEMMLADRAAEIVMPDLETRNAQTYAERRDWTLAYAVDQVQAARARFLAVLDPLGDEDLERAYTIDVFGTITVRAWIQRRSTHDRGHIAPLLDWRTRNRPHQPGPRCVLLPALDTARQALLAWHEVLPARELASRPLVGSWTYQDLLGHVVDWEDWLVRGILDTQAGHIGGSDFDGDIEAWNMDHVQARQGEDFAVTWDALMQCRWDLLELLKGFDDARLAEPVEASLSGFDRFYFWFTCAGEHDQEHAEALEQALA